MARAPKSEDDVRQGSPILLCSVSLPLLLLLACSGPGETPPANPAVETPKVTVVEEDPPDLHRGVDVSMHSGAVDWKAVRGEGHSFAFVKATEGVDLRDSAFAENWQAMKEAGLVRGAYHFYVTEDDPEEQARFYIETVDLEPGDLAPVVDIELMGHGTRAGLSQRLHRFLDLLEEEYGVKPIVYTSPRFWNQHLDESFGHYPLWVAEYEVEQPSLPRGWSTWHVWQWQEDAQVPGVEKGADLSRVNREALDPRELLVGPRS